MNKIYAQMYSVKEHCEKNFAQALKDIAEIGYTGVELAGYYEMDVYELKNLLRELSLEVVSAHVSLDLLTNKLDEQIAILNELGAEFIVCPYAEIKTVNQAKELADTLNKIGKKAFDAGLTLLYHNHAHELKMDTDQYLLEVLFNNVDSKYVKQQMDVYWIAYAGIDPIEYVSKHADRIASVHLKQILDMNSKKNVNAGSGIIDFKEIMDVLPDACCIYEQEHTSGDIMADMKKSYEALKEEE